MLRKFFRLLPLSLRTKKLLKYFYFRSMAVLGIERFTALNELDRKMLVHLPQRGGVFVEAGANDGLTQSNTWFLEAYRGWSGLLVEPLPEAARLARRFRRAPVANVALGPDEADGSALIMADADLTTTADLDRVNGRRFSVTVRSLSTLLDEYRIPDVDFLSLDVEGSEIGALDGLDLSRHAPKYILVETGRPDAVRQLLAAHYRYLGPFSAADHLFQRHDVTAPAAN